MQYNFMHDIEIISYCISFQFKDPKFIKVNVIDFQIDTIKSIISVYIPITYTAVYCIHR